MLRVDFVPYKFALTSLSPLVSVEVPSKKKPLVHSTEKCRLKKKVLSSFASLARDLNANKGQ